MPDIKYILNLNDEAMECEKKLAGEFERSRKLKKELVKNRLAIMAHVQKFGWEKTIDTISKNSGEDDEERVRLLIEEFFEL